MSNLSVRGSLLLKMTLVFGLIVAIGCLVLSWVSETRAAAALEAEAREAMLKVARQVAETQDSRIQARLYVVESLANKNVIRGRSGDREATLAEKVQLLNEELEKAGSLGFKRLAVLDRDGNAVYQNGSTANLADREYFRRAMEGNTNVSTSMVSKVDQTVIFGYAAPIRHYATGEIVGAVAGIVDGAKFSELVGSVTYGRTGYAFAVDSTGKIIAHKDTQKALDQENILEEAQSDASLASLADVVAKMVQGEEGVSTYTLQGQEMIIAYAPLKTAGWSIAVTAPRDEVLERAASLRQSVLLVSLLVTVLAVVLTYVMARSISTPIADLAQVVTKFAEYDFRFGEKDKASRHLKRKDEVGQIANALAGMQSNLVNLIRDLKTEAQTLSGNSASLSAASEEMASSSDEVAKAIQQVAAGAGEQAGHLQEILGLMENITTNLERVRTALGRVKANSEDTSARAGAGKKELDNLVGSIEGVREAFKVVVEKLEVLRDSVGQVEEILEVINGIAEQTNLLALNAAIEAARAGEAGRGFAVVAEEVRKLAEQSRASSDKIRELLGSITLRTGEVVSTSEKVTSEVASQLNNVENTIKAFDDILAAVTAIGPLVEATYREVEATVQAKDVALERVQSISAVAEETSASAEEISASAEELSASTQEIASNAQQVLEVARRLEGQVERFQV